MFCFPMYIVNQLINHREPELSAFPCFLCRATLLLGILPQELLGTSMYEYYHVQDIAALTETHKAALQTTEVVTTAVLYSFISISVCRLKCQYNYYVRCSVITVRSTYL